MWEVTTVGPGLFQVSKGKLSEQMRPKQAAAAIGVSVRTIYDWISDGTIRYDEYRRAGGGKPKTITDTDGRDIETTTEGHSIWICASAVRRLSDTKHF